MKPFKFSFAALLIFAAAACNNSQNNQNNTPSANQEKTAAACCDSTACETVCENGLIGAWDQPIEGMEGRQGFQLDSSGTASSINMATLVYEKWSLQNDSLVLSGKSIGNGQTIEFTETYRVVKPTADSLVLTSGEAVRSFTRVR